MRHRRMSAESRKQAIVKAALPLFARKGFAETTTRDLAQAAGVSEPLLYKHFPSKEALYLEIQNFSCSGFDPVLRRLNQLEPCTATLVHLVYYLLRTLILATPSMNVEWDIRHRLMLNSLLHDGAFAKLIYKNRFAAYCSHIESCLEASIATGDAVKSPVTKGNLARFAYHIGAWLALVHLPGSSAIDYRASGEELLNQAVWFSLRGMGLTDKAIANYYQPSALALLFDETRFSEQRNRPVSKRSPKA